MERSSTNFTFTIELAELMPPLADKFHWASQVTRIYCGNAGSLSHTYSPWTLHRHWGTTQEDAIEKAAAEFEEWRARWLARHTPLS